MNAIAPFPDLDFPVVVTPLALPNPQNHAASAVTGQPTRVPALDLFQTLQLDAVVHRSIAVLLSDYLRAYGAYANPSLSVTYKTVQLPMRYEVPARRTPFGHLNFLASPVEGLYFDPDDVVES